MHESEIAEDEAHGNREIGEDLQPPDREHQPGIAHALEHGQPAQNGDEDSPVAAPDIVIGHQQAANDGRRETKQKCDGGIVEHVVSKPALVILAEKRAQGGDR